MLARQFCKHNAFAIAPRKHVKRLRLAVPAGSHAFAVVLQARTCCIQAAKAWHPHSSVVFKLLALNSEAFPRLTMCKYAQTIVVSASGSAITMRVRKRR